MAITESQPTDKALILAARAGDKEAFAQLVQRHFRTVWTIAYARLRQASHADDLAQEVFLIVFVQLKTLADPDRFGGWISRITRNRTADWLRTKQRSSKLVAMVPVEALGEQVAEPEESGLERREENDLVREAIFRLPAEQRELVLLRFAEGLNQSEIARRLDVHPVTVARQLEKAMATLRGSLEEKLEASVHGLQPSRRAVIRTAALVTAVTGMSGVSRAALGQAAGKLAAPAATSILKGALLMSAAEKLKVAVIAAAVLLLGLSITVIKMRSPASPAAAPVVVAAVTPANTIPEPNNATATVAEPMKASVQTPAAKTAPVADQFTGWVNFSDGTTVEFLGIQCNPLSEKKWWTADGTVCPMPPHQGMPRSRFDTTPGRKVVWMIMRLNAGPAEEGRQMKVDVVPSLGTGMSMYGDSPRSLEVTATVPEAAKTVEVHVGMAAGPWVNDVTYDVASKKSAASSTHAGWISSIAITEEEGKAIVEATWIVPPSNRRDLRMSATALGMPAQIRRSTINTFHCKYYFECAKSDITQVLFQSRPYETMIIKNVSLVPLEKPARVEISDEKAKG